VSEAACNLLVISDLHLGDGIRSDSPPVHPCDELCDFIQHYTRERRDDLPWHLIINGDMVDFIGVCLMPDEAGLLQGLPEDDHYYGLGTRPHAAALKMSHVLTHHEDIFQALAGFMGVGNRVSIVVGNHDAAFHFEQVQQALRDSLSRLWQADPASREPEALSAEGLDEALTFCPWFYFEKGVAWIEHGHQYDPYCSFDSVLDPATDERDLDPNVDSAIMHYVSNHFMKMRSNSWNKGFFWYLSWSFQQGASKLTDIYGGYRDMVFSLLSRWKRRTFNTEERRRRRKRHAMALKALAAKVKLGEDVLIALHNLRQKPIINELGSLIQGLMLDRLLLLMLGPLLVLVPLFLPWPHNAVAWLVSVLVLIPTTRSAFQPRISPDPREFMRQVTSTIRRKTQVPIVVFGHSHDPAVIQDDDEGLYFNTGSWVPHSSRDKLDAFTHVMIQRTDSGLKAMLCKWKDGESLVVG
jgi:UDP-2,3-diacylglucosamine pyrophosphatase LpxH